MPPLEVRHYESSSGRDAIARFLDELPASDAARCVAVINWLRSGEIEYHRNARKHLDGDIWELRARSDGEQFRFLFAVESGIAYLLVPVHKKRQKVDRDDIRPAQTRFDEARRRSGRS